MMNYKVMNVIYLTSLTVLITACGGGSSGGTLPQGGSVTGGTSKIPTTISLPCKTTQVVKGDDADLTFITESGASGSLTIDCARASSGFKLKEGVPNLNIKAATITDYYFCADKQGKGLLGWIYTHDLTKGNSKMVWSEGGKAFINCHATYPSPLPKTISSSQDIEDLKDYWADQDYDLSNCTYSTQSRATSVSCDEGVSDRWLIGTNATLIDSSGKTHKTSERTTYITKKH